jgi:hypothetical protein
MKTRAEIIRRFDWKNLSQGAAWEAWRNAKISTAEELAALPPVAMDSLSGPGDDALDEVRRRCALGNFALYRVARTGGTVEGDSAALVAFGRHLGVHVSEEHRSAGHFGVVALRTSDAPSQKGYIPYSTRPLNWHTDGYYNPSGRPVKSFILHCHAQAAAGGENQLIDPELAYLAMREESPDYVRAMMHPEAMTIPENREADGTLRPASVGPVFFADDRSGRMQMRYTARTRSIEWRDDPATREAADWLRGWLMSGTCPAVGVRLGAGEGVVSNNALHNRTGFEDGGDGGRVMLRVRFHDRMAEELHGAA